MSEQSFMLGADELATLPTSLAKGLLADRVVIISGGGSGIGRATAWLAARLGARVVIGGRDPDKLARTTDAIVGYGLKCESVAVDIRSRSDVDALFHNTFSKHGRVDLLVNSAGGQFPQAAIDFSEKGWRAVIDTNLTGTFNMMQRAAQAWRHAGMPGSIVTIVVSPRGLHQVAHTCAARAGVVAFSEAVAVEWAPLGIRVNCIAPGAIVSEGWATYAEHVRARYPETSPLRRAGSPWEIAEAALFVGGPGGSFITGQTLHINGGGNLWGEVWTAGKPSYFVEASRAWEEQGEP
jgi:NAD(P)-dependent dehydrogenase (short-subunit alcohol dehydrogenase family)